jgi:purine-binding chemotaxis protein CheW
MTRLVSFQVAGVGYGIDAQHVIEILRPQPITRVPHAPPAIAGLINLRGHIIAAIDLACRLGIEGATGTMNVLVRTSDGPASLLVDKIGDVLDVDPASFLPAPATLPSNLRGIVTGSYPFPDRLVLVLEPDRAAHCQDDGEVS